MRRLVLLRHGQSESNRDHRFTGWSDVALTSKGIAECQTAGRALARAGFRFDVCFTSALQRAIDSARATLEALDQPQLNPVQSWRLNERHFGALQDLTRNEAVRIYGRLQVMRWQRSYAMPPPPLEEGDPREPVNDRNYAELNEKALPRCESLSDTFARVIPYWQEVMAPHLGRGRTVLVVAHKNSLRVLAQRIEGLTDEATAKVHLPTAQPLVYDFDCDFDSELRVIDRFFLTRKHRKLKLTNWLSPA